MRVLGIDTALRSTGFGVVESKGNRFSGVDYGTIKNPQSRSHSECLKHLHGELVGVLARTRPEVAAIEGGFFFKNARTALVLGEARGVVIAACATFGIPIYEYSPRHVKQALTGFGSAEKDQVAKMVVSLLGLQEIPGADATDALAIAIAHINSQSNYSDLKPEPI